jgi:predicted secreted protein
MPIEIPDSDPPAPSTVARDDEVVIRLAENATTGYRWQLTPSGSGELALVEERFVPGSGGAGLGAGGHRLLRYVGRKPGEVRIDAVLRREWDSPGAALEKRVFAITVS